MRRSSPFRGKVLLVDSVSVSGAVLTPLAVLAGVLGVWKLGRFRLDKQLLHSRRTALALSGVVRDCDRNADVCRDPESLGS